MVGGGPACSDPVCWSGGGVGSDVLPDPRPFSAAFVEGGDTVMAKVPYTDVTKTDGPLYKGEDAVLVLTGTGVTNPMTWVMRVTMRGADAAQVDTFTVTQSGITVTSVTGTGPYTATIEVAFPAAVTGDPARLGGVVYRGELWRIDDGSRSPKAVWDWKIETPVTSNP